MGQIIECQSVGIVPLLTVLSFAGSAMAVTVAVFYSG